MPLRVNPPSSLSSAPNSARRAIGWWLLVLASVLLAALLALSADLPLETFHVPDPAVLAGASATPVTAAVGPAAVRIETGEGDALVASWTLPDGPVEGEGLRVDAVGSNSGLQAASWSEAVRAGASAVTLPTLPSGGTYTATVTVVEPGGSQQLGPSEPFTPAVAGGSDSVGSAAAVGAASVAGTAVAAALPCRGATYGIGAVTVDGWAGYQGSYCLPPTFSSGTGAFCIDHGLDYPFGGAAYGWKGTLAGNGVALVNQYDAAVAPAEVARLDWVLTTWGSTTDPARATAIGVITHAVMGDYPGLNVGQLDPATFRVEGGDPAGISADAAQMWAASAGSGAPYSVAIHLAAGPYDIGQSATGTVTVTGAGGVPVSGQAISFSGSTGVSVLGDQPVRTDASGTVGFRFIPAATSLHIAAATAAVLPGPQVEVWTPTTAPVATQRVVTPGPAVAASGSLNLSARALGQAALVKLSADPSALGVGSGFTFAVQIQTSGGGWSEVATRSTSSTGVMTPIDSLLAGTYRVIEEAAPPGFLRGGPWTYSLAAGQDATWTLTDQVRSVPLQIVKTGSNPRSQPIGAGVTFSVTPDPVSSNPASAGSGSAGSGSVAGVAVGTWVTEANGQTPAQAVAPGRYLISELTPPAGYQGAAPIVVDVPPATTTNPAPVVVDVEDQAIPGTIVLRKTDARSGALIAGARLQITKDPVGSSTPAAIVGIWTSATAPISVPSLLAGPYTVTELTPPAGYQEAPTPSEEVVLGPGETLDVTFADAAIPAATTTTSTTVAVTTTVAAVRSTVASTSPATSATTTPSTTMAVAAAAATSTSALAFTGSPSVRLVGWALVLGGGGVGLVGLARCRRSSVRG